MIKFRNWVKGPYKITNFVIQLKIRKFCFKLHNLKAKVVFFIDATDFIFHHGLTVRDIEKRFFAFNWKLKKLRPKFFDFFLLDRLTGNSRFYRFLQFLLNNKQKYMKTMFLL